ncbi:MAG TPA: hypothetical protein O0W90_02540 [Methanocorpusculum sp.]|nr:hypothetical protein [Methanocorpusculum sp.]
MDKIVEDGLNRIEFLIEESKKEKEDAINKIIENDSELLSRMTELVTPIIPEVGQVFITKAKQDIKGELYDQKYYSEKMILLLKSDNPVSLRPDNPKKKVDNQYCVLSENGQLSELMFSNDGFVIDSYLSPISAEEAISYYGYEIMYILYSALSEYCLAQQDVIDALNITLGMIQKKNE